MDEELRALERSALQGEPGAAEALHRARTRSGRHETLAELEAELERLQREHELLRDTFVSEGERDFGRYLSALFASEPGLQALVIRGYTPGFLDGDLCEHTQSVVVDDAAKEELEDEPELARAVAANALPRGRADAIERALGAFEPVLHALHGTDWQLVVRRGKERAELGSVSPWECGY